MSDNDPPIIDPVNGPANQAHWARLDAVLPGGGIYRTRSARFAGRDVLPSFIAAAEGCRITDVDGRTYLDFNCGNGPNLLGYKHPEVDAAAAAQSQTMDLTSFFPEALPAYAERLLQWGKGFDWTIFAKNGSDCTNLALRVMRVATQRPYVVLLESAYHGFGMEIALAPETQFEEHQKYVLRIPWNDAEALRELGDKRGHEIAGIMVNPLDQSPVQQTVSMSPEMVTAIHELRSKYGGAVTLDDVRHGFRLHPQGSHYALGLEPDLLCLGKGQANGYSTSALLGREVLRTAAEQIQFTATYMFSAVAYRAGIATLDIYEREHVFAHLQAMGERLVAGIERVGREAGHEDVLLSGPVTMPTFLFTADEKAKRARVFARHAARLGAIFHPTLNWFLSYAHKAADIDEAVDIARRAFAETPTRSAP